MCERVWFLLVGCKQGMHALFRKENSASGKPLA